MVFGYTLAFIITFRFRYKEPRKDNHSEAEGPVYEVRPESIDTQRCKHTWRSLSYHKVEQPLTSCSHAHLKRSETSGGYFLAKYLAGYFNVWEVAGIPSSMSRQQVPSRIDRQLQKCKWQPMRHIPPRWAQNHQSADQSEYKSQYKIAWDPASLVNINVVFFKEVN